MHLKSSVEMRIDLVDRVRESRGRTAHDGAKLFVHRKIHLMHGECLEEATGTEAARVHFDGLET